MVTLILSYHYNTIIYERKITAARDYALRTAKEKTSILANVSHDVRTPVNSLVSVIDLLKNNTSNNRVNPALLDSITKDIHVINDTVEDILNLGKLESGMLEIKEEYFSPANLLANLIKMQQSQADKKGLKLISNIAIEPDTLIKSGAYRLRQIVSNLLSNAIKYTDKGQVEIKAFINPDGKKTLQVEVSDTGKGISSKDQEHIFEQYYMTDLRAKNSFGLGLHISKLMAEQLNGTLSVQSKQGRGSTFTLIVPIADEKKSLTQVVIQDNLPLNSRIVIVDDNPINNLFVKQALQQFKDVQIFQDSSLAMEYLQNNTSDIVITDLNMNGPSGWDILNLVKGDNTIHSANSKVIALTSDESQVSVHSPQGQIYQFDGIMVKPFHLATFVQILTS
ncbi:Virulence sensor protein BvgS precursor [compost metagenome]